METKTKTLAQRMGVRPGTEYQLKGDPYSLTWVPWEYGDLDPNDRVAFVPLPIPSLFNGGIKDEDGCPMVKMDVNDLECWLTAGKLNTVNRFFYNAYKDSENLWRETERFKRNGPEFAPWSHGGMSGQNTWHFQPSVPAFGIDEDGRYVQTEPVSLGETLDQLFCHGEKRWDSEDAVRFMKKVNKLIAKNDKRDSKK